MNFLVEKYFAVIHDSPAKNCAPNTIIDKITHPTFPVDAKKIAGTPLDITLEILGVEKRRPL